MYDALADASDCASAISKINEKFILITYESANWKKCKNELKNKCKALFYIGKSDAEILYDLRAQIPLVMQCDDMNEAVMLASFYRIENIETIIFIPGVETFNGYSKEELIEQFINAVNNTR